MFRSLAISAILLMALPAWAGTPVDDKVSCPIGGPKISIIGTASCSTGFGKIAMSLRRPSSCDFVTRLPVCKRQDFPVYREFSKEEKQRLKAIVKTDWYQAARSESRYLRAYLVEKELGTFSSEDMFWLLQSGHFFDSTRTYGNATFYNAFRDAANAYIPDAPKEQSKMAYLMAAFARVHSDDPSKARTMLKAAKDIKIKDENWDWLDAYHRKVEACISKPNAETCDPNFVTTYD